MKNGGAYALKNLICVGVGYCERAAGMPPFRGRQGIKINLTRQRLDVEKETA